MDIEGTKEFKVRPLRLLILFPVLTRTYHYRSFTYTAPSIRRNS